MAPGTSVLEETPLLSDFEDDETQDNASHSSLLKKDHTSQAAQRKAAASRHVLQLCILMLLFDFCQYSVYAPLTAVFEEIICDHVYPSTPHGLHPHRDCKSVPVQYELAVVKGYKDAISQIPSIFLSVPLGVLADRVGRRPIILLFLFGIFLNDSWVKIVCLFPEQLPLRLIWLGPVLKAFGGGANFGTSMIYTAAADVIDEKDRVDAFMKLSAMEMVVLIAGAPLISTLMSMNNWYPLALSSVLLVVAGLIAFMLPETHPQHRKVIGLSSKPTHGEVVYSGDTEDSQQSESSLDMVRKLMVRSFKTSTDLLKNAGVLLALSVFLLGAWGAHCWAMLLQFVSEKFDWEFSTANLLFSLRGSITLLLSLVVIGVIDRFIQRRFGITAARKDLLLSMGSCVLIIIGVTVVGLAQSSIVMVGGVVISALGSSLLVSFRCAIIALFPETPVAPLNAVAAIAQSLGVLISGPVLAAVYTWGLSEGGIWTGAPFLLSSFLHIVAFVVMFYLLMARSRIRTRRES